MILIPGEQGLSLTHSPLAHPQLRKATKRAHARATSRLLIALQRPQQLALGTLPVPRRGQHPGIHGPAPEVQWREAAAPGEIHDRPAPFGGSIEIRQPIACDQGRATRVADRQWIRGLPAGRRRHRLIQQRQPPLYVTRIHPSQPKLRQRRSLEVAVAKVLRKRHGGAGMSLLLGRPAGRTLRSLNLEPAALRTGRGAVEKSLRTGEPSVRDRDISGDPMLRREIDREVRGRELGTAAAVQRICLATTLDSVPRLPQPPQRSPEAVQRFGIVRVVRHPLEKRIPSRHPICRTQRRPRRFHTHPLRAHLHS